MHVVCWSVHASIHIPCTRRLAAETELPQLAVMHVGKETTVVIRLKPMERERDTWYERVLLRGWLVGDLLVLSEPTTTPRHD